MSFEPDDGISTCTGFALAEGIVFVEELVFSEGLVLDEDLILAEGIMLAHARVWLVLSVGLCSAMHSNGLLHWCCSIKHPVPAS